MPNIHAELEVRFPRLNNGGREYKLYGQGPEGTIESAAFASDFLTACDGFSITYNDVDPNFWPEAQPLEIYLDGALQLVGRAEIVKRGGGKRTATITGRDYLADLTEDDMDASFVAKSGMTLEQCLLSALAPCGITSIVTPQQRNAIRTKANPGDRSIADIKLKKITARQVHDLRPKPGEKAFAYANRLVVRSGATIQPGIRRSEIVIQGPTYDYSIPRPRVVSREDRRISGGNNAINPESERNWSSVPSFLIIANQTKRVMDVKTAHNVFERDVKAHASDYFDTTSQEFRNILALMIQGRQLPGKPRTQSTEGGDFYRLRYVRDVKSRTQEQVDGFGYRTLATALRDTLKYTAHFRGITDPISGLIWAPDSLVDVDDDVNRIFGETLWCSGRHVEWSTQGVDVTCEYLRPKTFVIEIPDT